VDLEPPPRRHDVLRASEHHVKDQPEFDLYFALRAMLEVARRFDRREDPPSSYRLAAQFGTTDSQMLRVLRKLSDSKLVQETTGEWVGYVPGCDPDRITVEEVTIQIEGSQRIVPDIGQADDETRAVGQIFETLNRATHDSLERMTIGHLVRNLYSPRAVRADDRVTGTT
jgi:DNA-binding IscR family transcriptional regulator